MSDVVMSDLFLKSDIVKLYVRNFFEPDCRIRIELPLRRTLVLKNVMQQQEHKFQNLFFAP